MSQPATCAGTLQKSFHSSPQGVCQGVRKTRGRCCRARNESAAGLSRNGCRQLVTSSAAAPFQVEEAVRRRPKLQKCKGSFAVAGLRVPCQTWTLLLELLRKRRECNHTADTKDWACDLGLDGTGGLRTEAVRWWNLDITEHDDRKSVTSSSQKSH